VRSYLRLGKLKCFTKTKKPFISEKHKEKRLDFAEFFFNFSFFDWKRVIWSDECKFALLNTNKKDTTGKRG
jgi:hypothetical protein